MTEDQLKEILRESERVTLEESFNKKRGLKFDPTINAGHMLSALVMLIAGFGAYASLASRVTVLEERNTVVAERVNERANEQKEAISGMRTDIKDIQRAISQLTISIAGGFKK